MVVVPTRNHVEMSYGYTWAEGLGWTLTLLGLAGAVVLNRRRADVGPLTWRPGRRGAGADEPVPASPATEADGDGADGDVGGEGDGGAPEPGAEQPPKEGELVPVGSATLAPEGDTEAHEAPERPGDAAGDRGP